MKKLLFFFLACASGNVFAGIFIGNGLVDTLVDNVLISIVNSGERAAKNDTKCYRIPSSYFLNKNNSHAVVAYKKEELSKNVKLRRNGRLQQPKK
ncbi:MAG: hypothetical protein WC747_00320 [Candidatus Babeliales bacterium]